MDCGPRLRHVYTDGWCGAVGSDYSADISEPHSFSAVIEIGAIFFCRRHPARFWSQTAPSLSCVAGDTVLGCKKACMDDAGRGRG